jgi:hypothetical protein
MRARVMVRADRFPADTKPVRWSRSSAVSVTRYFLAGMAGLLPTGTARWTARQPSVKPPMPDH